MSRDQTHREKAFATLPQLLAHARERARALKLLETMERDANEPETPELHHVWRRIHALLSPALVEKTA